MPLIALWKSNPDAVGEFRVEQVVATAGDGILKDGSDCSKEIQDFFGQISSGRLASYAEQCLVSKFDKSGMVLQDIVNELGRRLDYKVLNGRYQGIAGAVGYDGIWKAPEGKSLVLEVKTTDTYRISLDTISEYRRKLVVSGELIGGPSILIVVGRQDTGELEAQVRGSRHAWDIRLISVEALCKLIELKEASEDSETGLKIREILTPLEYTKLDRLVDVMFTTAREVVSAIDAPVNDDADGKAELQERHTIITRASKITNAKANHNWDLTDGFLLQSKRDRIIAALSRQTESSLIKKSRALYWTADHEKRVACTMSKVYEKRASTPYWYAFHPQWAKFLSDGHEGKLVLGCMDLDEAFVIPQAIINEQTKYLNTTVSERGLYWHIHLTQDKNGDFEMLLPKSGQNLPLSKYVLKFI